MAEAVCVPARLALPGSPQAKKLRHLHAQLSLGQSCHRQKGLAAMRTGSCWSCSTLCDPVYCGLPGFSVREGFSRQENWSVLANIGSHTLLNYIYLFILYINNFFYIFPASLATNSPEYLMLPEPLRPKQLHHLHTWASLGQTQVLQGSLRSKPQWTNHMQRWK